MTKPEPVAPPVVDCASMETTDGSTRCAISATDPTGRSMVEVERTKLTECPNNDPVDEAPIVPAIIPTTIAIRSALFTVMLRLRPDLLGASHQGP